MRTSAQSPQDTSFLRSLTIQARVIGALIRREMLTRYGRHNIGFLWLFFEPALFTLGVTLLWTLTKAAHSSSTPVIPFALTGYSSVLLWRNVANRCPKAIESNLSLMYHRNVKILDVVLARIILEVAGTTMSFTFLTGIFVGLELAELPKDVPSLAMAWASLALFGSGLGLVLACVSEQSEVIDRVWHTFTYLFFPFSGAAFLVDWLPSRAQPYALLIPTVHGAEWLRHAYFGEVVRTYEQPSYLLACAGVLIAVGLFLTERLKRTLEPE